MKILWTLLLVLLSVWATEEENDLNRLSMSVDDEGNTAFTTPVNWNKNFFSAISYLKTQSQLHESAKTSGVKSEAVIGLDVTNIGINLLTYQTTMENGAVYAVGLGGGVSTSDFDQVGYAYQNSTNYLAQYSTGTAKIYQAGVYADFAQTRLLDFFSYRIGMYVYPFTYYDYTETATAVPTPDYDITVNDKSMQSLLQYDLFFVTLFEPFPYVSLMIDGAVQHRSLERAYISYSSDRSDFILIQNEYELTTVQAGAKLLFTVLAYSGVSPSIGIKYGKVMTKNSFSSGVSDTKDEDTTVFTVGLDKPF